MQKSFDWIARPYAFAERLVLGGALQLARTAQLQRVNAPRRALLLGEGDGRFALTLLQRFSTCEVQIVDGSARMLQLCERRLRAHAARVELIHADARTHQPSAAYDLITTLFFLDCFGADDQQRLLKTFEPSLLPSGQWLYADFIPSRDPRASMRNRWWLWLLYRVFRSVTDIRADHLSDPLPRFAQLGLHVTHEQLIRGGLLHSCVLQRSPPADGSTQPEGRAKLVLAGVHKRR